MHSCMNDSFESSGPLQTDLFRMNAGTAQDSSLSPLLFLIYIDPLVQIFNENNNKKKQRRKARNADRMKRKQSNKDPSLARFSPSFSGSHSSSSPPRALPPPRLCDVDGIVEFRCHMSTVAALVASWDTSSRELDFQIFSSQIDHDFEYLTTEQERGTIPFRV